MFKKFLPWYLLALVVLSLAFIYGCGSSPTGGGGATTHGTYSYHGTQSPGDVWSWTISAETFFGSNETTGMWLTGTWETLPAGFGKATVSTSEGLDHPSAGDKAYFLEFPNTMLLVKPDNQGDSRVMVCAAAAATAPDPGKFLFVNIPKSGWVSSDAAFGTVEASLTSGKWHFNVTNFLITGELQGNDDGTADDFVYSNGTFTCESGPSTNLKIFMTPSNVFFGDSGPGEGGFAGAKYDATITDINNVLNHTYKGVRFIHYPGGASNNTGETEPITAVASNDGVGMWASSYSDIDTSALPGSGVNITFESSPVNGFTRGYVEDIGTGQPEIIQAAVSRIGADQKYMIYGIGLDERNRSFNFLIIQTD